MSEYYLYRYRGLAFGYHYNQPLTVGALPASLRRLVFGAHESGSFNQILCRGILSPSLTQLVLGERFNQCLLPGVLPDGVGITDVRK